jgi:hypothetical protein
VAADLLNDRMIPFFDEHQIPLQRILSNRGTEYCGAPERHEYELYPAVENIDHTRTKVKSPQTNGIVERFHKTVLNEFYRVTFRRKNLLQYRTVAGRSRCLAPGVQRRAAAPGQVVLRQKPRGRLSWIRSPWPGRRSFLPLPTTKAEPKPDESLRRAAVANATA